MRRSPAGPVVQRRVGKEQMEDLPDQIQYPMARACLRDMEVKVRTEMATAALLATGLEVLLAVLLLPGLREVGAGPLALARAACRDVMIVIIRTVESDECYTFFLVFVASVPCGAVRDRLPATRPAFCFRVFLHLMKAHGCSFVLNALSLPAIWQIFSCFCSRRV
jgi:hypothetical protein